MTGITLCGAAFTAGVAANHIGRKVLALRDIHRAALLEERHTNVVRLLTPYRAEAQLDLVAAGCDEAAFTESTDSEPTPRAKLHAVTG